MSNSCRQKRWRSFKLLRICIPCFLKIYKIYTVCLILPHCIPGKRENLALRPQAYNECQLAERKISFNLGDYVFKK